MIESDIYDFKKGNTHVRSAIGQLVKDGYLERDPPASNYYLLLASGSAFISDGGYKMHFERLNEAEELQMRVHEASIAVAQSVKDTNTAIIKNNATINNIMNRTLLVAVVSVVVAIVSLIENWNPRRQSKSTDANISSQKPISSAIIIKDSALVKSRKDTIRIK